MELREKIENLRSILRIEEKKQQISKIKEEMNLPDFWLDERNSSAKNKELKTLEGEIGKFEDIAGIAEIASDDELKSLRGEIEQLEFYTLLSGKYDNHNALISIYAGAGGDDAQDWAEMLLRMYLRFAEANDFVVRMISSSEGAEAGIKSATFELQGSYAYGKLRGESGVHRLVRQSPFNAKALRQTSFALVEVMPEIEQPEELQISPDELKVDVYRSGGHGGQSVNTTDSAVRITHLPTGIVVTCQNERSQLQNKETAMKVLRSRLAQLLIDQHKEKIEELRGNFSAPEWGNQIRSYVLHPYKMVKDHRTGFESKNPEEILNGDIEKILEADLRYLAGQ